MKKIVWGTRFGFYFAAMGSAFGLGSLWRFPYMVSENGGGAFVLMFAALVFIVGMPLLIAELLLGKSTKKGVMCTMKQMREEGPLTESHPLESNFIFSFLLQKIPWAARLSLLINLLVLSYYAVICGWVLYFLMQFSVSFVMSSGMNTLESLETLMNHGSLQVLLTSVHLLLVVIIVAKDVENGIERWVGYAMPVFGVLLFVLIQKSLTMGNHMEAFRFLFYPDFSKLNLSSLGQALGHVFFALSLGLGTIVTFGSYLKEKSYIPIAGFRVATFGSMISILAGLLVFPIVFSITKEVSGPQLLFKSVPVFFNQIPGGKIFGVGFFLCMYLAALSASVGLFETLVANLRECFGVKRNRAAWITGGVCFLLALLPALSSSTFKNLNLGGMGLLELLDNVLINWVLPFVALAVSFIVCNRLSEKIKSKEFLNEQEVASGLLYRHWIFAIKWVVPFVILLSLFLQVLDLFL